VRDAPDSEDSRPAASLEFQSGLKPVKSADQLDEHYAQMIRERAEWERDRASRTARREKRKVRDDRAYDAALASEE
jgi:hypothetical protein